jgi:predicted CXXCH cytochrome family protein
LAEDYFASSVFDHGSHLIMKYPDRDESLSGADACNSCHEARLSEKSSDLLMTDIDNCTQCHGSPDTSASVELQCISCHQYHPTPTINLDEGSSPP